MPKRENGQKNKECNGKNKRKMNGKRKGKEGKNYRRARNLE
jgi:hypothetical protein